VEQEIRRNRFCLLLLWLHMMGDELSSFLLLQLSQVFIVVVRRNVLYLTETCEFIIFLQANLAYFCVSLDIKIFYGFIILRSSLFLMMTMFSLNVIRSKND